MWAAEMVDNLGLWMVGLWDARTVEKKVEQSAARRVGKKVAQSVV
jgi:hypothetical protein